jgi:hypothetical protein
MTGQPPFDWAPHLEPGERLQWTGQPDLGEAFPDLVFLVIALVVAGPFILIIVPLLGYLYLAHARDRFALTDRRVMRWRRQSGVVESLPRAGTHVMPVPKRSWRSLIFTAPDGRKVAFRLVSRVDYTLLIGAYPAGGPQPKPEPAG